jgi:hypothetical protein
MAANPEKRLRHIMAGKKLKPIAYAALVAATFAILTIGLASSSWADWCNGACY